MSQAYRSNYSEINFLAWDFKETRYFNPFSTRQKYLKAIKFGEIFCQSGKPLDQSKGIPSHVNTPFIHGSYFD